MGFNKGDANCTTGLSKRIYDNMLADPRSGFSAPMSSGQTDAVKALCWAIAQAVVDEALASAVVTGTAGGNPLTSGKIE